MGIRLAASSLSAAVLFVVLQPPATAVPDRGTWSPSRVSVEEGPHEDLTPEPSGAFESSIEFDLEIGRLQSTLATASPNGLAGVWREIDGERAVHVQLTPQANRTVVDNILRGFGRPALLRVDPARYSLAALDRALATITADFDAIKAAGTRIVMAAVDVRQNALTATVEGLTPVDTRRLQDRYGDIVLAINGEPMRLAVCTGRYSCTDMRGGIEINSIYARCSAAFAAVRGSTRGVITAGHCGFPGDPFNHAAIPMGTMTRQQFGGEVDAAFVSETSLALTVNDLVYDSEQDMAYDINAVFPSSNTTVGLFLVRSGITTGRQTGNVVNPNATIDVLTSSGIVRLTNQVTVSACALPGDSGGSVYRTNLAVGIVSTSNFATDGLGDPVCRSQPIYSYTKIDVATPAMEAYVLS